MTKFVFVTGGVVSSLGKGIASASLAATQRVAQGRVSAIPGSHLFPLEHPLETATEVLHWIASLPLATPTPRL